MAKNACTYRGFTPKNTTTIIVAAGLTFCRHGSTRVDYGGSIAVIAAGQCYRCADGDKQRSGRDVERLRGMKEQRHRAGA